MKRAPVALVAVLLLIFQSGSALASTDIYFDPVLNDVVAGHDYSVDVKIQTDQEILAYDIMLNYDTDNLNFSQIIAGDFPDNPFFVPYFDEDFLDEEAGSMNIVATTTSSNVKTSGTLATVTFHAVESGPSGLAVEINDLIDYDLNEIDPEETAQEEPAPSPPSSPVVTGGGGGFTAACTSTWNCTEWSICSGGIQSRTCVDLNGCKEDLFEENPCGGAAYHGAYPGAEGYTTISGSGTCNEGTRVCGSGGVVECRDGKLVKVETCDYGCEKGVCVTETGEPAVPTGDLILDPAVTLYAVLIGFLVVFGGLIAFYGIK